MCGAGGAAGEQAEAGEEAAGGRSGGIVWVHGAEDAQGANSAELPVPVQNVSNVAAI